MPDPSNARSPPPWFIAIAALAALVLSMWMLADGGSRTGLDPIGLRKREISANILVRAGLLMLLLYAIWEYASLFYFALAAIFGGIGVTIYLRGTAAPGIVVCTIDAVLFVVGIVETRRALDD